MVTDRETNSKMTWMREQNEHHNFLAMHYYSVQAEDNSSQSSDILASD